MEFAQTLLRLLRLLERLESCRTRRQFWYPTPGALWRHFRGTDRQEGDKTDQDEQVNDGEWYRENEAYIQLPMTTTRTSCWVK
jgi:hypothetical protein